MKFFLISLVVASASAAGILPSMSSLPGLPSLPAIPGVPSLPSLPAIPGVPSLPAIPSLPAGLPALPNVPSLPAGVPSLPSLPNISGPLSYFQILQAVSSIYSNPIVGKLLPMSTMMNVVTEAIKLNNAATTVQDASSKISALLQTTASQVASDLGMPKPPSSIFAIGNLFTSPTTKPPSMFGSIFG